jgi:hypothetical protein
MLKNKRLYSPQKLFVGFSKSKLLLYIGYKNMYQFQSVNILVQDGTFIKM